MVQPHNNTPAMDTDPAIAEQRSDGGAPSAGSQQQPAANNSPIMSQSSLSKRVSTEEEDLARAIKLSLQDRAKTPKRATSSGRQFHSATERSPELIFSLNNEFNTLVDATGDTALYFGSPPKERHQTDREYQYVKHHFDRVHVLKSENLRLMGDASKFTDRDLLNPSKSFRAERRLRNHHRAVLEEAEAKHGGKFTYYIDLRPPKEDDEAVILITEQTCTRGVLTWHLAKEKYDLPSLLVLGHDEFGVQLALMSPTPQTPSPAVEAAVNPGFNASSPSVSSDQPADAQIPQKSGSVQEIAPEYSDLRHYSALERLLQAIQGNNPKLDSAPKMWTFFALARYFGCASHERVSGWVTAWIYSGQNANFIQNNPEVAYRIAMGIQSPDLLKDSFALLVGERALIEAYGEYRPQILTPLRQNVHGRKLELLDDDERNRIDHAASSLVKRIREIMGRMCRDMDFLSNNTQYQVLEKIVAENAQDTEILNTAKHTIKEYVRSRIYYVLCQEQNLMECHEADLDSTLPFRSATAESFTEVYKSLNQPMRLFTNTFWIALQNTRFDEGLSNLAGNGTTGLYYDTHLTEGLKGLYKIDPVNGITQILRQTLDKKISAVNWMLHARETASEGNIEEPHGTRGKVHNQDLLEPSSPLHIFKIPSDSDPSSDPDSPFPLDTEEKAKALVATPTKGVTSPMKRRKTSQDGGYTDALKEGDNPISSHVDTIPPKKVSFAASPTFDQEVGAESVGSSNVPSTRRRENGPSSPEKKRDIDGTREHSYGNSTSVLPTWTNGSGRLTLRQGKAASTFQGGQEELALRPKSFNTVNRNPPNGLVPDLSMTGDDKDRDSMQKVDNGEIYEAGVDARSGSLPDTNPIVKAAKLARLRNVERQQPGWLDTPRRFYNPTTGKWEEVNDKWKPVNRSPQTWRQSSVATSPRVVKQAFSNSNTPAPSSSSTNAYQAISSRLEFKTFPICSDILLREVNSSIGRLCSSILYPSHVFHQTGLLPTNLFDTLLCLNENEFRYLPLWAPDGNDDGSGGVFDETPVPNLDPDSASVESFGPGRIRRGYQEADSVMSGSDFEEVGSSQAISTVGKASKLATDGTHTVQSLSSTASVFNAVGTDADTVVIEEDDSAIDNESVIHVGEDARGVNGDEKGGMNQDDDLGFDDSDEDNDTINGDDPLDKEMSLSLKAFLDSDAERQNLSSNSVAYAFTTTAASTMAVDYDETKKATEVEKGKAKAQNYPHGLPYVEDDSRALPFREREHREPIQNRSTGSISKPARVPNIEEDDDEYEFL